MKVRVTPTHKNGYSAPYFVIEPATNIIADALHMAKSEAESRSRLSDFDCWFFYPELIR